MLFGFSLRICSDAGRLGFTKGKELMTNTFLAHSLSARLTGIIYTFLKGLVRIFFAGPGGAHCGKI